MEIVIKIEEERYNQIKRCADNFLVSGLERAVKNGTPLPKGHGDLIDKSDLLTTTDIRADGSEFTYVSYSEIDNATTIVEADKEGN